MQIRKPAVAGQFYPGKREELIHMLDEYFAGVSDTDRSENKINALIAPHAGYIFSGIQAAKAYRYLEKGSYDLVCIISPSHREYFKFVSIYSGDAYDTPLGVCPVHEEARSLALTCEGMESGIQGHRAEHALEVQLPFIQYKLEDIPILPMVMGDQSIEIIDQAAACINKLYNEYQDRILFVASSDLSHFHTAHDAMRMDQYLMDLLKTADINTFYNELEQDSIEACGGGPILSILKGLNISSSEIEVLGYSHSGEVLNDNESVVGYTSAIMIKEH